MYSREDFVEANKSRANSGSNQKSARSTFQTDIFTKIASSKPPPRAFSVTPNVPVFLAHRSGCEASYKTTVKFNKVAPIPALVPRFDVIHKDFGVSQPSPVGRSIPIDHQHPATIDSLNRSLSPSDTRISPHTHSPSFALTSASALSSLLEAAGAKDVIKTVEPATVSLQDESFHGTQFNNPPVAIPKAACAVSPSLYNNHAVTGQLTNQFIGQHLGADQPTPNTHYNFKSYVDELSNNMTNLVVNELPSLSVAKASEFTQQIPASSSILSEPVSMASSQSEVGTPFVTRSISPTTHAHVSQQQRLTMAQPPIIPSMQSVPTQINKSIQPLISVTINKISTTQHSIASTAQQQHHQPSTAGPPPLPPNLPMLGQLPPGYPLFNLSAAAAGNSVAGGGGPATIMDLEQFNFIQQQHRILYELQQQQHHQAPQQQHQPPPQGHQGV
ncbi:unnamed protein product, partial [Protopolystoma xenopodis]